MPKVIAINRVAKIGGKPLTGEQCPDWREEYLTMDGRQCVFHAALFCDDGIVRQRKCRFPIGMSAEACRIAAASIVGRLHQISSYSATGPEIAKIRDSWAKRWYSGRMFAA